MKGLTKISLVVLSIVFLSTSLISCNQKEWSESVINKLDLSNEIGWARMACVASMDSDSGTVRWLDDPDKSSTIYIANGLSKLVDSPNFLYIVCAPTETSPVSVWHKEAQAQIVADLRVAGKDPLLLDTIVKLGNQSKANPAPSSLSMPSTKEEMAQLFGFLPPTSKKGFAVSPTSKKPTTWGFIKGVE